MKYKKTAVGLATALLLAGASTANGANTKWVNGQGTLDDGARHFAFNAKQNADGSVTGQAQLVNRNFTGSDGPAPYRLHVEITCMKDYGNRVVLGGTTKSTNDLGLIDAVFFTVVDNGEPGAGGDEISRTFFWDDIPETEGDPQACELNGPQDFPTQPIEAGNIQVR
jgi:hypothetical protein